MVIRKDKSIDAKIVEMRKGRAGLYTISKWVSAWDNFKQLDEIIVLVHILNVLDENNLAVSKNEVRNNFNRFYKQEYHGDKQSYLSWIYRQCKIKDGTIVKGSQIRNKRLMPKTSEKNKARGVTFSQNTRVNTTNGKMGVRK